MKFNYIETMFQLSKPQRMPPSERLWATLSRASLHIDHVKVVPSDDTTEQVALLKKAIKDIEMAIAHIRNNA